MSDIKTGKSKVLRAIDCQLFIDSIGTDEDLGAHLKQEYEASIKYSDKRFKNY